MEAQGEQIWQGYTKRLLADLLVSWKVGQSKEEGRSKLKKRISMLVIVQPK